MGSCYIFRNVRSATCIFISVFLNLSGALNILPGDSECNKIIPQNYERKPPPPTSGEHLYINVGFSIIDIDEINESSMDFRLHIYLLNCWEDSRLVLQNVSDHILEQCVRYVWVPDVVFETAKDVKNFDYTFFRAVDSMLWKSDRYSMKTSCLMNFRMYPFDTQDCVFSIGLMTTTDSEGILQWISDKDESYQNYPNPILFTKKIEPLQFHLKDPTVYSETLVFLGNFTYLMVNFTFARRVTGSIVSIYIPSALIVMMSWVTFWIRVDAAPARVSLSITSLLTLCTQVTQYKSQLPAVNYVTAMDIWLFVCILMVFSTLLNFAISYNMYMKNKECSNNPVNASARLRKNRSKTVAWTRTDANDVSKAGENVTEQQEVTRLDLLCRKLFPVLYIIFIIIYWLYYLNVS